MQQDPQIFAAHAEAAGNLGAIGLLEEHHAQDLAILGRERIQNAPHHALALFGDQRSIQIDAFIDRLGRVLGNRRVARVLADGLEQDVVADRADEGSKGRRLRHARPLPQGSQHTQERLLAHVLGRLRRDAAHPQLGGEQASEIAGEVQLGVRIALRQPGHVSRVEDLEFEQRSACILFSIDYNRGEPQGPV